MKRYFTRQEILLWSVSILAIAISFICFDRNNYLTLVASLIGATSLIFNAKGNPIGQFLMIIFKEILINISISLTPPAGCTENRQGRRFALRFSCKETL